MKDLQELIVSHEDWLMNRVLQYAKDHQYVKYTSTLVEAWRTSIVGLSEALIVSFQKHSGPPDFGPDEDFGNDSVASFGILEAQRHRSRGVTLGMFLGLMKYYRQSYLDLVITKVPETQVAERHRLYLDRFFDRIELGFVTEWAKQSEGDAIEELQASNRAMTNEKNKYLTIFESLANPVILLNTNHRIENMNHAALQLFSYTHVSGAYYYGQQERTEPLLWLSSELEDFERTQDGEVFFDKVLHTEPSNRYFEIKLKRMLDISGKFTGIIVILNDITQRKQAIEEKSQVVQELKQSLAEVKKLSGLLPICSACKKIRDDQGYWHQVEEYVKDHSEAEFSHSICPNCMRKLYPEVAERVLAGTGRKKRMDGIPPL